MAGAGIDRRGSFLRGGRRLGRFQDLPHRRAHVRQATEHRDAHQVDPDGVRKRAHRDSDAKARTKMPPLSVAWDRFACYELAVTSPTPLARFLTAVHGRHYGTVIVGWG